MRRGTVFYLGDAEITKREILASVSIVAVMLLIGILISGKISEAQMDANEVYNKAIKIESTDLFQHGMDTNVGNAFVYGNLEAVDTVTYPEIGGEYIYIVKIKEEYTKHTRTVTYTDSDGNKKKKKETYWTWDEVDRDERKSRKVIFCGIEFDIEKIDIPEEEYIETIKESSKIRYKYYGVSTSYTGTIFTDLRNQTIPDGTKFYEGKNIEETVEYLQSGGGLILFWIVWIVLTCGCVYGFCYMDNRWLE